MPTERLVPLMIQRQPWLTVPKPSENGGVAPTEPTVSIDFARDESGAKIAAAPHQLEASVMAMVQFDDGAIQSDVIVVAGGAKCPQTGWLRGVGSHNPRPRLQCARCTFQRTSRGV